MYRPFEDMGRVKVKGFSILDDDFDLMAADLCRVVPEESSTSRVREALIAVVRTLCWLWQGAIILRTV
jgi:hypothetical protein